MAKQRKNSYRLRFTLPNGKRVELACHTQQEAKSVSLNVNKLISAKKTGIQNIDAEEWAARLPRKQLKENLIRWQLVQDDSNREKTIGDLCAHFQKKGGITAGTLETFEHFGKNLIDFFGESKKLREISPEDASGFEHFLRTSARRVNGKNNQEKAGTGLSEATTKKRLQRARQFFREAVRLGWVDRSPFEGIHGGNVPNKERWVYISTETTLEVMQNTPNLELRALLAVCRFAGARGGSELNSLQWNESWIKWSEDGKQGTLRLHRQKTEKSGFADTIVPMVPELEAALRDWYDATPEGTIQVFKPRNNPGKVIKDLFIRKQIDIISPYNLRRSYCRDLMQAGLDAKSYEIFAGHSLSVALKFYQSWDETRAQKATPQFLSAFQTNEGEGESPLFCPHLPPENAPCNNPQEKQTNGEKNRNSLENGDCFKKQKAPCELLQGAISWGTGI